LTLTILIRERMSMSITTIRIESYRLSKPYPYVKFVRTAQGFVVSILHFYARVEWERELINL
jgi:hypothetical protein